MTQKQQIKLHEHFYWLKIPDRLDGDIFDEELNELKVIDGLSKVNVFVGKNNSGKSLFLRELLKSSFEHSNVSHQVAQKINEFIDEFIGQIQLYYRTENIRALKIPSPPTNDEVEWKIDDIKKLVGSFNPSTSSVQSFVKTTNEKVEGTFLKAPIYRLIQENHRTLNIPPDERKALSEFFRAKTLDLTTRINEYCPKPEMTRIYCPTIRTLRKYSESELLADKTKHEYGFDEKISVENGQQIFDTLHDFITSDEDNRNQKNDFERFISESFFQDEKIEITPHRTKKELVLKKGSDPEHPIYDLGDGLQMIIILTFPLFKYPKGVVLIEEPEVFMHPGLQKQFFRLIASNAISTNHQFFISTHSNHILEAASQEENVSIYSIQKKPTQYGRRASQSQFILSKLSQENESALRLLGVSNNSVFLANCTIWVEGVTDLLYLRKFISEYLKNPKPRHRVCQTYREGLHYMITLSGGSNIVHFDFSDKTVVKSLKRKVVVRKLCGRAFVLVDKDHEKNRQRKQRFFRDLGGRFHVLPTVEIENLLSDDILVRTINSYPTCKNLSIPEKNKGSIKRLNTRIGSYIENFLLKDLPRKGRKKFIPSSSNQKDATVNNKLDFCDHALPHIDTSNMTKESFDLVEKIMDFIKDHNPSEMD